VPVTVSDTAAGNPTTIVRGANTTTTATTLGSTSPAQAAPPTGSLATGGPIAMAPTSTAPKRTATTAASELDQPNPPPSSLRPSSTLSSTGSPPTAQPDESTAVLASRASPARPTNEIVTAPLVSVFHWHCSLSAPHSSHRRYGGRRRPAPRCPLKSGGPRLRLASLSNRDDHNTSAPAEKGCFHHWAVGSRPPEHPPRGRAIRPYRKIG
jgi:hypothetical protein